MPQLVASAPFQVEWQPLFSRPLQAGEVRLHTRLSAISVASELSLLRDGPFPRKLGYQTLATVTEAAPETGFSCGQRVVSTLGHTSGGIASAGRVFAVPDHMADRQALCLVLGEETHKGIRKVAPQTAENVLIAGAGLLGLLSVFNLTRRGICGPLGAAWCCQTAIGAGWSCPLNFMRVNCRWWPPATARTIKPMLLGSGNMPTANWSACFSRPSGPTNFRQLFSA